MKKFMFAITTGALLLSACSPMQSTNTSARRGTITGLNILVSGQESYPTFSPNIKDYAVYCTEQTGNRVTFTVTAPNKDTSVWVNGKETKLGSVELKASADDLMEIVAMSSNTKDSYYFRCLPPDFPKLSVKDYGPTEDGWYLLTGSGRAYKKELIHGYAIILDEHGVPVWYKAGSDAYPHDGRVMGPINFSNLSDGSLAWFQTNGLPFGANESSAFERFTISGKSLPKIRASAGYATNHHELLELPDGSFLITVVPLEAPAKKTKCLVVDSTTGTSKWGYADMIGGTRLERVDPTGKLIWSWDADPQNTQHKAPDSRIDISENTVPLCFLSRDGKNLMAAIHPNAIAVQGDTLLLSGRHVDAIYGLNMSTGKLIFKFGGTARKGLTLKFTGDPSDLPERQHDVHMNDSGHLTIMNNHSPLTIFGKDYVAAGKPTPASFSEYSIDIENRTVSLVSKIQHPDGIPSLAMGSARITNSGSVLIGWGSTTKPSLVATEFSASGERLRDINSSDSVFASYRVLKVAKKKFKVEELRKGVSLSALPKPKV